MSEIPPSNGPGFEVGSAEPGGQPYASYHRGGEEGVPQGGSSAKLIALRDGYYGLNWVFALNVALAVGLNGLVRGGAADPLISLAGVGVIFILIAGFTFPHNKKIGFGLDWQESGPAIASILMGLNSALCCGILGYVIVQGKAAKRMKDYGLTGGFFGMKKDQIQRRIEELQGRGL